MADKQNLTFERMYGRLEKVDTPEKVSGVPVSRSSRELLEKMKEEERGQS